MNESKIKPCPSCAGEMHLVGYEEDYIWKKLWRCQTCGREEPYVELEAHAPD